MRIALVHDWLTTFAGAEKVLAEFINLYPDADVYCVCDYLAPGQRKFLRGKIPRTTFIQKLPFAKRWYRSLLPLMPLAIEQLDLSGYDVIISSSHAVAKGVLAGPDQLHVSYVHTPVRYAWDLQHQYLAQSGLAGKARGWLARLILHRLRIWDVRTANNVDVFVANSRFIGRRIDKAYRRDSTVIYPPVDVRSFEVEERKEDFYLTASRLVPYKRVDLIVKAFAKMPNRKLVVIGDGPEWKNIAAYAEGCQNISLLGYQSDRSLIDHMRRAKAFVFAAEEDFGITPVEAQACGTPVIAFGRGGALETVRAVGCDQPTGLFFYQQTDAAIVDAVNVFEAGPPYSALHCRANAERFSVERFKVEFSELVKNARLQLLATIDH